MTAKFAPEDILKPRNPAIPPQRRCFSSKSCFFFFSPTGSSAPNHKGYHSQTRSNKRLFRVCSFEPTSFRISTSVFSLYSIPKNFKISQQPSGSLTPIQTLNTLSSRVPRPSSTRGPGVGHARGPGGQVIRAILRAGGGCRTAKALRQRPPFQARTGGTKDQRKAP